MPAMQWVGKAVNRVLRLTGFEIVRSQRPGADFEMALDRPTTPIPDCGLTHQENPLRNYFDNHTSGPGIWKWLHYFDIYHRHLAKFRGRDVHLLEIGVYSGGSLGMWRDYFGHRSTIYGVDIEPACKVYDNDFTKISIGDQGDRLLWQEFKANTPLLDVVIDDGSHASNDQIRSLKELLPHLRPGGVYICEDVHARRNRFAKFVFEFADTLNNQVETRITGASQRTIESVALYPFVVVITKNIVPLSKLVSEKRGTEWQPFLS